MKGKRILEERSPQNRHSNLHRASFSRLISPVANSKPKNTISYFVFCATYPSLLIFLLFIRLSPPCSSPFSTSPTLHNSQAQQSQTVSISIASPSKSFSFPPPLGPLLLRKYRPLFMLSQAPFHAFFLSYLVLVGWATSSPLILFILFIIRHPRHDYFTYYPGLIPSFLLSFVTLLFLCFLLIIFSFAFSQSAIALPLVSVKVVYYVMYTGPSFFI